MKLIGVVCVLENQKALENLKKELGNQLLAPEQLSPPEGMSTGHKELDHFLLWKGIPKGELSLFHGHPGLGSTSLWSQTAGEVTRQKRWAAWVNTQDFHLCPWPLHQRGGDLSKFLTVSAPHQRKELIWCLQELLSLCLFDLVGCHLKRPILRPTDLQKLKKSCKDFQTGLVFVVSQPVSFKSPDYSLILSFQRNTLGVERALHKPTPYVLQRRLNNENAMFESTEERIPLCG